VPLICVAGSTWTLYITNTRALPFTLGLAYSNGDYAAGALTTPEGSGESAGDDLTFAVYGQTLDAGVGTVTFDADTDVPCAPQIACVIGVGADDLVLTGDGWETTITGPFVEGDVVVIDARNFTVAINGDEEAGIEAFDRTGRWPSLQPGSNTIEVAPAAATQVQWKPRREGLI